MESETVAKNPHNPVGHPVRRLRVVIFLFIAGNYTRSESGLIRFTIKLASNVEWIKESDSHAIIFVWSL